LGFGFWFIETKYKMNEEFLDTIYVKTKW
jgi:hypothetical protein